MLQRTETGWIVHAETEGLTSQRYRLRFFRIQNLLAQQWHAKMNLSFAIDRQEAVLRTACSPLIVAFIERMNDEFELLRKFEPSSRVGFQEKNLLEPNPRVQWNISSNGPAIKRRIEAIVSARSRAEELKVLPRTRTNYGPSWRASKRLCRRLRISN